MKLRPLVPSFCTILMLTCSQPLLAQQNTRLNGHRIVLDSRGKLLSWVEPQERAYDHIVRLGWDFILNKVPVETLGSERYLRADTTGHGQDGQPHGPLRLCLRASMRRPATRLTRRSRSGRSIGRPIWRMRTD